MTSPLTCSELASALLESQVKLNASKHARSHKRPSVFLRPAKFDMEKTKGCPCCGIRQDSLGSLTKDAGLSSAFLSEVGGIKVLSGHSR